jgi:hypothetical protein
MKLVGLVGSAPQKLYKNSINFATHPLSPNPFDTSSFIINLIEVDDSVRWNIADNLVTLKKKKNI